MPRKLHQCSQCSNMIRNDHTLCIQCTREQQYRRCASCGGRVKKNGATLCRKCYESRQKPAPKAEVKQAILDLLSTPTERSDITDLIGDLRGIKRSPHIRIGQFIRKDEYATLHDPRTNQKWYVLPKKGFYWWTLCSVLTESEDDRRSILGSLDRRTYVKAESWPPGPFQWAEDWQKIWWAEPATNEDWPEDCYTEEGHLFYDHGKTGTEEEQ